MTKRSFPRMTDAATSKVTLWNREPRAFESICVMREREVSAELRDCCENYLRHAQAVQPMAVFVNAFARLNYILLVTPTRRP